MSNLHTTFSAFRVLLTYGPGLALILLLREAMRYQRPDMVDANNRVRNVDIDEIRPVYDFIIIGGGSGGSVMASRLSEMEHWNVLLLEAGPDESLISEIPLMYPSLQKSALDWDYWCEPSDSYCLAMDNSRCSWPRGKVLGGSSVLNAMLYVRGNRKDYDRWAACGNPGWNYDSVLYYFKKAENMRDPNFENSYYHGTDGYLSVEPFRTVSALKDIFLEAAAEMNLLNPDGDLNGKTQFGFARSHGTIRDGLRCSTNKAYIRPASHRFNLHVSLQSFVEKILIDPGTKHAYGVVFSRDGEKHTIYASREVILSAGAINSPQILKLSGVGSTIELLQYGIHVIHDLPGVGENLQDHVASGGMTYLIKNPISDETLSFLVPKFMTIKTARDFIYKHKGPLYGMPASEVMAFINSKYQNPHEDWPDIQLFLAAYSDVSDGGIFGRRGGGISLQYFADVYEPVVYKDSYMIIPLLMRPLSRGRILLSSSDPKEYPMIFANYFDHPHDLDVLVSTFFITYTC